MPSGLDLIKPSGAKVLFSYIDIRDTGVAYKVSVYTHEHVAAILTPVLSNSYYFR